MKIRELLRECLSVLSPRDRRVLYLAAALQAALNIADELFRHREHARAKDGTVAERAEELERLLDRVLIAD